MSEKQTSATSAAGGDAAPSQWYLEARLGKECCSDERCPRCEPTGNCDACDTVDGRWIEAVSEYASTCDWCGELTHHENLSMDTQTQLGYCPTCVFLVPPEILERLERKSGIEYPS